MRNLTDLPGAATRLHLVAGSDASSKREYHNVPAEEALLGTILYQNETLALVSSIIDADHFYDPVHEQIYRTLGEWIDAGKVANPVTLKNVFSEQRINDQTYVWQHLATLQSKAVPAQHLSQYAEAVIEPWAKRRLAVIADALKDGSLEPESAHTEIECVEEVLRRAQGNAQGPLIISAATLEGKVAPPREWAVNGMIPHRNVTYFGGEGAAGKSTILQHLAASATLGRPWLGNGVRRGPVLYVNAEDDLDEMHRRMEDIARSMDVSLDRFEHLHLWSLAGEDAVQATADERNVIHPTARFRELERRVASIRPVIVGLDPLIALFPVKENDRAQVRGCVSLLRRLAIKYDTAVVLAAHPSLRGIESGTGSSGSTDWGNSVRSRMFLERIKQNGIEPDETLRTLRVNKLNYGPKGGAIHLRWQNGVFELEDADPSRSVRAVAREAQVEETFLDLLDAYAGEGRPVCARSGSNYAPTRFAEDGRAKGITRHEFIGAMNRLFAAGKITNEERGPPSKRSTRIARSAA
jgi:RecA-family ATPase